MDSEGSDELAAWRARTQVSFGSLLLTPEETASDGSDYAASGEEDDESIDSENGYEMEIDRGLWTPAGEFHPGAVINNAAGMPMGSFYQGALVDGMPHGRGRVRHETVFYNNELWQNMPPQTNEEMSMQNRDVYDGHWVSGKYHGSGKLTSLASGLEYEGEFADGSRHGIGICKWQNGNAYDGEWRNGLRHGFGTKTWASGDVYIGQWAGGKEHGKGTLKYSSGNAYEGQWVEGARQGQGKFTWKDGDVYEGQWVEGTRHGQGKFIYANGNQYEGGFQNGKLHGQGKMYYSGGGVYEGEFADGVRNGTGTYKWENGTIAEGRWENGKLNGHADKTFGNGSRFVGEWRDGKQHGTGTYTYASGKVSSGEWKEGLQHGMGSCKYANGKNYVGEWDGGAWNGLGACKFANGDEYIGEWRDSKQHGLGTFKTADGYVQEGEWREDSLVRTANPFREKIRYTLFSILEGIDGKLVSHLTDLVYGSGLVGVEDLLRPWLQSFTSNGNVVEECSHAVLQCAKRWFEALPADFPDEDVMFLNVVDEGDNTKERYALLRSGPFEAFLKNYAAIRAPKEKENKPKPQSPRGKRKKHKKSNRKKSMPALIPESKEEKMKEQHSQALSKVFEEADTQFRDIRQRLAALNLERTMPKQRKSPPKKERMATETPVDNPPADGLGGKAGKSHFIVQVGEASNLYNTRAKPSTGNCKQPAGRIDREVDLHGCTKEEALAQLNECLPEWMDTAMKGEYPWVIAVRIVCGGGSQILAEAVESWIKRNPNVSNAPKNLYS